VLRVPAEVAHELQPLSLPEMGYWSCDAVWKREKLVEAGLDARASSSR